MNGLSSPPTPSTEQDAVKNESSLLQKARKFAEKHRRWAKAAGGIALATTAMFGSGIEGVQAQDDKVEDASEQDSMKAILENLQERARAGESIAVLLESLQGQLSTDQTISVSVTTSQGTYTTEIAKRDNIRTKLSQMTQGQLDVSRMSVGNLLNVSTYGVSVTETALYIVNGDRNSPDYGVEYGRIIFSDSNRQGEIETPEDDFGEGETVFTVRQKLEVGETYELKIKDEFTVPELAEGTVFRITGYNGAERKYNVVKLDDGNQEKPLTVDQQAFFDAMFPQGRGIQPVIEVRVPDPNTLPTPEDEQMDEETTPTPTSERRKAHPTPTPDQASEEATATPEGNSFTVRVLEPFTLPGSDVQLALNIRGVAGIWDDQLGGISRLEATWSPDQKAAVEAFNQGYTVTYEGDGSFTISPNGESDGEGEAVVEEAVTPTPRRQETLEVTSEVVQVRERGTTMLKLGEKFSFSGIAVNFLVEKSMASYTLTVQDQNGKRVIAEIAGGRIFPKGSIRATLSDAEEDALSTLLEGYTITVQGNLGNETVRIQSK